MSELTRSDVLVGLQEVFRSVFNDEHIVLTDTTTAADIEGWDSLQQIKVILACERKFKIKLRARDVNGLDNVGSMVDHLISTLNRTAGR